MTTHSGFPSAETCSPVTHLPNARQRILVVENDPLIRRLNTQVLIYSGYQVDAAEGAAIAWSAIQSENYDLIITNNDMPTMSGIDLLQSLHEAHQLLPVILTINTFPRAELAKHLWLKIQAILIKPYSSHELVATVKNVLAAAARSSGELAPPPNWSAEPLPSRPRA